MLARDPAHASELIDTAFQEADIDTLVSLYDDAAVLFSTGLAPGRVIRGNKRLRDLCSRVLQPGACSVSRIMTHLVEADDFALFTSRWSVSRKGTTRKGFFATVVFRKHPEVGWIGGWKDLTDSNPAVSGF